MLLIICVERLLHIGSHFSLRNFRRRPHFPTKLAAVASFSYKIGGKDLATLLAAVLTWSGYWRSGRTRRRATYFATYLHKVLCITEICYPGKQAAGIPVSFAYYMTLDGHFVTIALESLQKKKSIHWTITPPPTLPCLPSVWLNPTALGHA